MSKHSMIRGQVREKKMFEMIITKDENVIF